MRVHAFILAACVCAHARAASIPLELDNVDLDEERLNAVESDIPVKVVEVALDESSNDYVPPDDAGVIVKRIEVDLKNPGPPQRQEHETQNPENGSENDKIIVSIKNSIKQAENVFNEGLNHVSDSFKTFLQADENLPLIQQNIKNWKESFTEQFEKLNATIRSYLTPNTGAPGEAAADHKLKIVQAHLKILDSNFKYSVDTLTEGVEVYSIIKEEDEAEKAIALKAEPVENPPSQALTPAVVTAPATGTTPWNQVFINMQSSFGSLFETMMNSFGGNNANGQNAAQPSPTNGFFGPIQNIWQGLNIGSQPPPAAQENKPANAQADPVPAPAPAPATPWPQSLINTVQTSWSNFFNPGQNNQPQQITSPQPAQQNTSPPATNGIQQVFDGIASFISPQRPQAQQPANPAAANPSAAKPAAVNPAAVAGAPQKAPESPPAAKPEGAAPVQGNNVVPAPVHDQPQAPPSQAVNPEPAQTGPIQQLVQNNPIIKGIQDAVQRIQGTPNPETPREEDLIQEDQNKERIEDPKGHEHGGHRPGSVNNQGDSNDSGREKVVETVQDILTEQKEVLEEQIKAKDPEAASVFDKTE